jgi:hypothetical protein
MNIFDKQLYNLFFVVYLLSLSSSYACQEAQQASHGTCHTVLSGNKFGKMQYEILLIDFNSETLPFLKPNNDINAKNISFLTSNTEKEIDEKKLFFVEPFDVNICRISLNEDGSACVNSYDERIKQTFVDLKNINEKNCKITVINKQNTNFHAIPVVADINSTSIPKAARTPEEFKKRTDRANLFDMFSPEVDQYILRYGFAEVIQHNNIYGYIETECQISMFGGLRYKNKFGRQITKLGFFQYTYSPSTNVIYHRFFYPLSQERLIAISYFEPQTAALIRYGLENFFAAYQAKDMPNDLYSALVPYLDQNFYLLSKYRDMVNGAARTCGDKTIEACKKALDVIRQKRNKLFPVKKFHR